MHSNCTKSWRQPTARSARSPHCKLYWMVQRIRHSQVSPPPPHPERGREALADEVHTESMDASRLHIAKQQETEQDEQARVIHQRVLHLVTNWANYVRPPTHPSRSESDSVLTTMTRRPHPSRTHSSCSTRNSPHSSADSHISNAPNPNTINRFNRHSTAPHSPHPCPRASILHPNVTTRQPLFCSSLRMGNGTYVSGGCTRHRVRGRCCTGRSSLRW